MIRRLIILLLIVGCYNKNVKPADDLCVELWGECYNIKTTTSLNLSNGGWGNNHLTGDIPSQIGNLVNLTYLALHNNQLTGDIPPEIGKTLEKYMRIDGITVLTNSKVEKITDNGILVNGQNIDVEKILVCVGRKPNIGSDEMKKLGIEFNGKGIDVNKKMLTSVSNIYAIGDITGKYQLAHVASKQGEVAAHNITGHDSEMDYSVIPFCVFTFPEVAFVGDCSGKSGEFPLRANAKANCLEDTRGFLKVFEKNGICAGAIIIGTRASELIGEATIAIESQLKIEKFLEIIHAHPTLSEAFTEAVRDINGQSIHLPSRTKS